MMSKLKISMLESVELNIQTDLWAIAGHCQTWRQATARLLGWLHHAGGIHFWFLSLGDFPDENA